ncbi:MAG: DUF6443 domain-containing protein [Chitinophagaceae bacterium]
MSFIRNIKQLSAGLAVSMACPLLTLAQQTTPGGYSQSAPINFVRTWDAVKPDTARSTWVLGASVQTARIATQYIDGLGRPLQTVLKQGSLVTGGTAADLVTAQVYDPYGRERYQYLPFVANTTGGNASLNDGLFKLNPFQQDSAFSKAQYPGETWFYAQTNFENSPLSRPQEAFAPGNSWVGSSGESLEANRRSVKTKYWFNKTADSVRIWNVTNVSGGFGSYASSGIYGAGQLQKIVTVDEHGKQVVEFKDKNGQVLLKKVQLTATADDGNGKGHVGWLCTYYMYDDQGRLRCVVQPVGVELLMANSWSTTALSNAILNEQCFRYEYDGRGRMIVKKVPGAGKVYMIYDKWDRLAFTQDSIQRINSEYLMTKYDELNRPVVTGIYQYWGTIDQMRDAADDDHYRFEERIGYWGNGTGYTTRCWPEYNYTVLTVTYYDDYSWLSALGNPLPATRSTAYDSYLSAASNTTYPYPQAVTQSAATKGLVTGTKTQILGTINYLYAVNFYDDKGRVIQSMKNNVKRGVDVFTTQYGWQGLPLLTITSVEKPGTNSQTIVTQTKTTYDSLGRVAKTEKKIAHSKVNSGAMPGSWTTLAEHEYDALGQLKKKKLDPAYNSNAGLDSLTYDYNIRGWMLGMNRLYAKDVHQNNYFGFDLGYDKAQNGIINNQSYTTPQYNGNISGMVWKSKGDAEKRKYDFTYDAANRILTADFNQYTSSSFNKTAGVDFSLNGMSYDANGNILAMKQRGLKVGGSATIDSLRYNYIAYSNKLLNVIDGVNDTATRLGDFRTSKYHPGVASKNTSTEDYTYDGNGNMIRDLNKDIGTSSLNGVEYNHLNLPRFITIRNATGDIKGTVKYVYDAAGNKLEKTVDEYPSASRPISTVTTTSYLPGVVVESMVDTDGNTTDYTDRLQFVGMEEGRIRPRFSAVYPDSILAFHYDYMLKDHLGNVRMLLTTQRDTSFYPVASLETASLATERNYYAGVDTGRVNKSTVSGYPSDTYTSPNDFIQKLNGSGPKTGTNMVLKVMAGDKVNLFAKSWYKKNGVTPGTPVNPLTSILNVLEPAIGGITGTHGGATLAQLQNTSVLDNQVTSFLNSQSGYTTSKPKAFVNWVLFDEQFKYVAASSGFEQVGADNTLTTHAPAAINISKGGYLYIYVSNETPNIDVFFDNLQVTHIRGPILEETHYYPFGLTMAGISSKALAFGAPENKNEKFQGQPLDDDLGVNWYGFKWRNHDFQIGRFIQIDPLSEEYIYNSTYAFSENKVTAHVELEGLEAVPTVGARNAATGRYPVQGDVNDDGVVNREERESWVSAVFTWIEIGSATTGGVVKLGVTLEKVFRRNTSESSNFTPAESNNVTSNENSGAQESTSVSKTSKRSSNTLEPDPEAQGDHVSYMRDKKGDIYKYQEWKKNDRNPKKFDAGKRFDGGKKDGSPGAPHRDKKTGETLETPHVNERGGKARRPEPNEIPNNKRFQNNQTQN